MLRDALESLATNSPSKAVVLDLAGVEYIDSTGMGALVSSFINAHKVGQRIVLSGLTHRLPTRSFSELMKKLRTIFDVYENTEEAVRSVALRCGQVNRSSPSG